MSLHLTPEYREGYIDAICGKPYDNPYDFFDDYEEHYAYDIGYQKGKSNRGY